MLTIFNVLLNRVVCHWISLTVEDEQVTHEELGMVAGRCMGVFNADDGMLGSRYPEWLQGAINVLIRLFRRVRLMVNVAKSKNMTCQPGAIHMGISEEAFSRKSQGEGGTYRENFMTAHPMPRLRGGFNVRVHDNLSQTIAWDKSRNRPGSTNSQPDRVSSAGV